MADTKKARSKGRPNNQAAGGDIVLSRTVMVRRAVDGKHMHVVFMAGMLITLQELLKTVRDGENFLSWDNEKIVRTARLAGQVTQYVDTQRGRIKKGIAKAMLHGTKSGKPIGRPAISPETEQRIRAQLAQGTGIIKTSKLVGVGSGTVQRIKAAMMGEGA